MTNSVMSSINLCPINFEAFSAINRITLNIEATLLYSKIFFHQKNSIIEYNGKTWIIRSRQELANWYSFSEKKIDSLLLLLSEKGLIEKKVKLWKGKKKLILHAKDVTEVPVNHKMLEFLLKKLGSIHSVVVFSKIAYHYNNSNILHENKNWCSIKKQNLCDWLNISLRKLDIIFEDLIKTGIILKKNFLWYSKRQLHFHVPNFAIETLYKEINSVPKVAIAYANHATTYKEVLDETTVYHKGVEFKREEPSIITISDNLHKPNTKHSENTEIKIIMEDSIDQHLVTVVSNIQAITAPSEEEWRGGIPQAYAQICRYPSAKMGISIIKRSNTKKSNNTAQQILTKKLSGDEDDISLINSSLSFRQERYLKAALEKTINRNKITISNPDEFFEELKFSICNMQQHKNISSFQHVVSRCMKIISQNNWKTPIGFYKYSTIGQSIKKKNTTQQDLWNKLKHEEEKSAQHIFYNMQKDRGFEVNLQATEQGIQLAKRVLELKNNKNYDLVSIMVNQIQHLISQGANGKTIAAILRNNR